MVELEQIRSSLAPHCLVLRGWFHPAQEDGVPVLPGDRICRTILLIGNLGGAMWPSFSRSPEYADGAPHPLDRWTRRIVEAVAEHFAAYPLFPFGGPPWLPFQRWAVRGEGLSASPLGILIHPEFGLWHAYRGVLALAEHLDLPGPRRHMSPCDSCAERPCLSTCPVGAFQPAGYDATSCRDHVGSPGGESCRDHGCMARLACPVGREHAYPAEQMAFHMKAFMSARRA